MDYKAIREAVRAARHERGMSQERLAAESKVGRVTIARLEAGGNDDQDIRVGTLIDVCRALQLEVSVLPKVATRSRRPRAGARA
jgi:transcriptional regulator with XRE-family HTH domain